MSSNIELNNIVNTISKSLGVSEEKISQVIDLEKDLELTGEDFEEFIQYFAEEYQIDMSKYLWYFHRHEEGLNIGSLFFKPPSKRVARIPITPSILHKAAAERVWPLEYPPHRLPKIRWDIAITICFFTTMVVSMLLLRIPKLLALPITGG